MLGIGSTRWRLANAPLGGHGTSLRPNQHRSHPDANPRRAIPDASRG